MTVYVLLHSREVEEDVFCSIGIGIYTSMEIVHETIARYKNVTGFKDYPDDFVVDQYEVVTREGDDVIANGFVYFLQHEYTIGDYDYPTSIGIYSNCEDVKATIRELKKDSCYSHYPGGIYPPDGFCIDKYELNKDHWIEGFVPFDEV